MENRCPFRITLQAQEVPQLDEGFDRMRIIMDDAV
jgi:hypothetical protein